MERLTFADWKTRVAPEDIHPRYERLAEYEDTGHTPEEIKSLQSDLETERTHSEDWKVHALAALDTVNSLQTELDQWKRESIMDKAKLGEIRILAGLEGGAEE